MAEQMSWTNPGSVNSAERVPPPIVSSASRTTTERPLRASSTAAARPLGPEPTTTASYTPPPFRPLKIYPGRSQSRAASHLGEAAHRTGRGRQKPCPPWQRPAGGSEHPETPPPPLL